MSKDRRIKLDDKRGTYYFTVDLGTDPATGKRRQAMRRGFPTQTAALAALKRLERDADDGTYMPKSAGQVTLHTFATDPAGGWLTAIRPTVEPSTWESYDRTVRLHVLPRIGAVKLAALTPGHLNTLYGDLLERSRRDGKGGLSPRTVRYVHTIVHRMLRDAAKWGRVARNVADLADPPSAKSARAPEMRWWTPEQLREFLAFTADERHAPAFRLAGMTGMRRGEVFGLLWADVDLDGGKVVVRRQLRVVRGYRGGHHDDIQLVDAPKSGSGRRTIELDAGTIAVLRAWRAAQHRERLAAGEEWLDHDFVFTSAEGAPVDPESAAKVFDRRVARSGLPRVRFHDLRHTHAVHLIAAGQHVKVVSERLGHTSTAFTMDRYGHVMPNLQSDAASAVAALVDGVGRG